MTFEEFENEYRAYIWEHSLERRDCAGMYGLAKHFYALGLKDREQDNWIKEE